jgi:hypothetical protein
MNISLQLKHHQLAVDLERQQARIALESGEEIEQRPGMVLPGDAAKLRGIPVCGVKGGFGGAVIGSRPDQWLPEQERRRAVR